jgi:hypothetical protein
MSSLKLADVRELEDMVITCIYNNLLSCRLDNKHQELIVEYVASRDFRLEDAPRLFKQLQDWQAHIKAVETKMETTLKEVSAKIEGSARRKRDMAIEADRVHALAIQEHEADRLRMRARMQQPLGMPGMYGQGQGQASGDFGDDDDYEHKYHQHH